MAFDGIFQLQKNMDDRPKPLGIRTADAKKVVRSLYRRPVTEAATISNVIGKSNVSAYKLIRDLENWAFCTK